MKIEKLRNPYVRWNEGCSVSMIDLLEKINEIIDAMNGEHDPADIYSEDGRLIAKKDESEDERIRQKLMWLLQQDICPFPEEEVTQMLNYLEKQKDLDKMIVVSPEVWDNAISDAFENGKKEGEHPEKQKPSAPNKYDEKMRKKIIDHLESIKMGCVICTIDTSEEIAWLEKQQDASKAIEAVDRIDKYIDEHLANAHDMKDSNPDKKYYRGWDDALGKMAGILQDVYSGEKQKEQKPASTEDMPYIADEHFFEREPADSFKYKLAEYMTKNCTKKEGPYGYTYGISAESILQMAKEELIKRGELKEQKPVEWKPSEEQMNALNFAITYMFSIMANPTVLRDLYDDLLKLKQS